MTTKTGTFGIPDRDLTVQPSNSQTLERANRLREAIRAAGGNLVVSQRSGVPISTLNNYLAGRDMKAAALIALAEACNVSVEWLATGRQPEPAIPAEPPSPAPPPLSEIYAALNIDLFAQALEKAFTLLAERGQVPDWRRLGQVILLVYDQLTSAEAKRASNDTASRKMEHT
jgi:transcriptional regulator with XRE-family HTH domain